MGKRGDGAQFDPNEWWKGKGSDYRGHIERLTPDGDLVPYPSKKCLCGGLGLTVPGVDCGAGFETKSCFCLPCARSQMSRAMDYALGFDVLLAQELGDSFYQDNDQGIG